MTHLSELNEEEEILINEEYKYWKKQSPSQYDMFFSQGLEWPSLTFEWLPSLNEEENSDEYTTYKALISSNAGEKQQSQIQVVNIRLSLEKEQRNVRSSRKVEKQELSKRFKVINSIPHNGQINRARHNPLTPKLIAAKGIYGQVNLFDLNYEYNEIIPKSLYKLTGHKSQGYGLSWSPLENGLLLSGSNDNSIALWNVDSKQSVCQGTQKIQPTLLINYHSAAVEDVAWHRIHKNIFGSCSDDRTIAIWDQRFRHSEGKQKPILSVVGHRSQIYSIDFSPFNQNLLLSGSEDKEIKMWDLRKMDKNLHSFVGHEKNVLKVAWSPFSLGVLASCSSDRRVNIWDMSRIGQGDKQTGLIFTHQGHRSSVPDFEWHPDQKLMIGSVQEANILQSKNIYYENQDQTK